VSAEKLDARSSVLEILDGLITDSGVPWGALATPQQREDAHALLAPQDRAPRLHVWTRPRSGSKTSDGAACAVAALVDQLPASSRAYGFAVDAEQSALVVDAAAGFIGRSGLGGLLDVQTKRIVNRKTDASIAIMSADSVSAYGLRSPWFWLDEFFLWPASHRALWTAIFSAVPKVEGCRLALVGTAGDPAWWTARVLDQARASPMWRVSETPGPLPWLAEDALEEQRRLLTDAQYARLHLNLWTAAEDRLVSPEHLAAAAVLDGPQPERPGLRYTCGVDIGLRHDRTAIAVCHAEPLREKRGVRVVMDRMIVFSGTRDHEVQLGDVEATLLEIHRQYNSARIRIDPWQAIGTVQRLRAKRLRVEEWSYTPQRYAEAAQGLFTLLRDGRLALYYDEKLFDELANVRLKETTPGLVRVDHDPGRHDDQAQALGFAVVPLVQRPLRRPSFGYVGPRGDVSRLW
jgi:phage terminase large subunit-like protein